MWLMLEVLGEPEVPVRWSVSFQVLKSSGQLGGFISSPWATAATRVIRQPKSTLGVARQQTGKASWPLVYGLLANQLALLFLLLYLVQGGQSEEKKTPTFPHIPLSGLCSAKSDNGFDYLVKSSSELHDLCDFAALFRRTLPTFSCANRSTWCWNLTFYFSLNSHTRSPLFLSLTHRATKSRGSITAGGLGDILIPYYWVQD